MKFFLPLHVQNALVLAQHILFGITSLLNALALICLLKQTPPNQSAIRNYLIYIQISLIVLDVFVDLLTTPVSLFPALGGYCVGFLSRVGLSPKIVVGVILLMIANITVSIGFCVIFKHQNLLLTSNRFKLSDRTILFIRCGIFTIFNGAPLVYIATPARNEEIDFLIDTYPHNISWIRERGSYYFQRRTTAVILLAYTAILILLSFALIIGVLFIHMFYNIQANTLSNSQGNSSKIRRSIYILFAQLIIPLAVVVFPGTTIFVAIATETWIDFEVCLSMYYLITLHSLVHNSLLFVVTPTYRRFIASLFICQLRTAIWGRIDRTGDSSVSEERRRRIRRVVPLKYTR